MANVTRADVREFLEMAAAAGIRPAVERYALDDANRALVALKFHATRGAKVLTMG